MKRFLVLIGFVWCSFSMHAMDVVKIDMDVISGMHWRSFDGNFNAAIKIDSANKKYAISISDKNSNTLHEFDIFTSKHLDCCNFDPHNNVHIFFSENAQTDVCVAQHPYKSNVQSFRAVMNSGDTANENIPLLFGHYFEGLNLIEKTLKSSILCDGSTLIYGSDFSLEEKDAYKLLHAIRSGCYKKFGVHAWQQKYKQRKEIFREIQEEHRYDDVHLWRFLRNFIAWEVGERDIVWNYLFKKHKPIETEMKDDRFKFVICGPLIKFGAISEDAQEVNYNFFESPIEEETIEQFIENRSVGQLDVVWDTARFVFRNGKSVVFDTNKLLLLNNIRNQYKNVISS